jgi:hypothetical protein
LKLLALVALALASCLVLAAAAAAKKKPRTMHCLSLGDSGVMADAFLAHLRAAA